MGTIVIIDHSRGSHVMGVISTTEKVGHSHVNHARMQLSCREMHARVTTSSGHCLVLLGFNLRILQNSPGS